MKNLFTYGTLMCDDIMYEVSGVRLSWASSVLQDYARYSVKGQDYPAVVYEEGISVDGVLYFDVPESSWFRLDRFEGSMYERHSITVELEDGTVEQADTYVIHPDFIHHLSGVAWDYDAFLRESMMRFQCSCRGF